MLQDQIWLHTALGLSGVSHGCFCLASKASERLRRINTYANNEPRACVDYSSYTKSSYLFLSSVGPSARLSAFISYIKKEAQTHPSSLKLPETVRAKKQNKMKQDLLKVVGVQVREIGAWVIQWSCLCVCVWCLAFYLRWCDPFILLSPYVINSPPALWCPRLSCHGAVSKENNEMLPCCSFMSSNYVDYTPVNMTF